MLEYGLILEIRQLAFTDLDQGLTSDFRRYLTVPEFYSRRNGSLNTKKHLIFILIKRNINKGEDRMNHSKEMAVCNSGFRR